MFTGFHFCFVKEQKAHEIGTCGNLKSIGDEVKVLPIANQVVLNILFLPLQYNIIIFLTILLLHFVIVNYNLLHPIIWQNKFSMLQEKIFICWAIHATMLPVFFGNIVF